MISNTSMRRLMRELAQLKHTPPDDIRVSFDDDDLLNFVGIIAGPEGTPYHGGWFKVKFTFNEQYPSAPPKCHFATKIFHPNVSSSGEICVNTLKKDWKATYGVGHVLTVIKCLLIFPNPDSALDEEAGKMLQEDYDGYCRRARLMTEIHGTRGGQPVEFQQAKEDDEVPLIKATLPSPKLESGFPSGTSSSVASSSGSSLQTPTSSITESIRVQSKTSSPLHATSSLPPLQTSAQGNGARSPAIASLSLETTKGKGKSDPSTLDGAKENAGASKPRNLKRPASSVTGSQLSSSEKRKKALKRL